MHAVAWDTARIWTYTIVAGFGCAWLLRQRRPVPRPRRGRRWLLAAAVPVVVANVLAQVAVDGRPGRAVHRLDPRAALSARPGRCGPHACRRLAAGERGAGLTPVIRCQ
ncbi:MAG: hypothetical protein MZV70_15940 [Desulfobacterales bacterium]|nr:hypothetical protein [Desulfobacterales bacterium]